MDGERLIVFPDGSGEVYYGKVTVRLDELGFVVKKHLQMQDFGPFGDEESHYWEGQDG